MARGRRAVLAGLGGGVIAGAMDAAGAHAVSVQVIGSAGYLHLFAIEAGLGAIAGLVLALVFIGWSLGLERLLGRARWFSGAHIVTLLLAAPLLVYDAFALFHGPQASRIPAHGLLSVLIILLGAAFLWAMVTSWASWLAVAEPGGDVAQPSLGRRLCIIGLGLALIYIAYLAGHVNRSVLPRLYPWFHLTLTLLELVACVLAVRLLLGFGKPLLRARWSWGIVAVAVLLLAAGVAVERPAFQRSQSLRYFVFEKTHLASVFARLLTAWAPTRARAAQTDSTDSLPPLPPGPRRRDSDVVLITIDAARADHLGCYGYGRPTSPHLDTLAASGVRFARAYTQAPHTSFAIASLMIGKYYPTLARLASSENHETLAAVLRRYGWKTAAFYPPAVFYVDAHKMKAFESSSYDFEYVKYEYLAAEKRVAQIEEFLRKENPTKLFLWLHLFEPHEPYVGHEGFDFGNRDVDRYDSEIAYSDSVVGKVVSLIQAKRPEAIIIVAADHGEEFGEHGGRYHGTTLFDEQVHIPLIMLVPGLTPHTISAPVQLVDIPVTILGLLDIPAPLRMRGTDLGPWLLSHPASEARLPPVFSEVDDKRMVTAEREKLICDIGRDFCSYYDLRSDPGERRDLADQRPDRVSALRARLDHWLGQQSRFEGRLVGAAGGGGALARAIERARLGDASVARTLAEALVKGGDVAALREGASLLVTEIPPRPESKPAILEAASKVTDQEVRDWVSVAAFRLGVTEMQARVHALASGPAMEGTRLLRMYAALVLAQNSDATGLQALTGFLESCDRDLLHCRRAIAALGRLGDARAVQPLVDHLKFVLTRRDTVVALAKIPDPAVIGPLIERLESDEYVSVRAAAARGLGHMGGARAVQALRTALTREPEESVLVAIRSGLNHPGRQR